MAAALRQVILRRSIRGAAVTPDLSPISVYFNCGGFYELPNPNPDLYPIEEYEEEFVNYVSDQIIADVKRDRDIPGVRPGLVNRAFRSRAQERFQILPQRIQMLGWDKALDVIQDYPQADSLEVFGIRMIVRWRMTDNSDHITNEGISKNEVISRVLGVMKFYPKLDRSKLHSHSLLTKEGHFNKDFGLNEEEWDSILWGLEEEFKLEIPGKIQSVKLIVEYIYENIRSLSSESNPTADQVFSLASLVIKVVDHFINNNISSDSDNPDDNTGSVILRQTLVFIRKLAPFKTFPVSAVLSLISTVFDHFQRHPKLNSQTVYHLRMYIRSMLQDKGKDGLTKDQIISIIRKVIRVYSVKHDSKFHKELTLDEEERMTGLIGLESESCAPVFDDSCMNVKEDGIQKELGQNEEEWYGKVYGLEWESFPSNSKTIA